MHSYEIKTMKRVQHHGKCFIAYTNCHVCRHFNKSQVQVLLNKSSSTPLQMTLRAGCVSVLSLCCFLLPCHTRGGSQPLSERKACIQPVCTEYRVCTTHFPLSLFPSLPAVLRATPSRRVEPVRLASRYIDYPSGEVPGNPPSMWRHWRHCRLLDA